jgi:hypothetical protein
MKSKPTAIAGPLRILRAFISRQSQRQRMDSSFRYCFGQSILSPDHKEPSTPVRKHAQSARQTLSWLTTQASPFWAGPLIKPSQVTVIGCGDALPAKQTGMPSVSVAEAQRKGPGEAARRVLQATPAAVSILLHIDIDGLNMHEMSAAYFSHTDGLSLAEGQKLLGTMLADSRMRIIEVTQYASLRDLDQRDVPKIVGLLTDGLKKHSEFYELCCLILIIIQVQPRRPARVGRPYEASPCFPFQPLLR